MSAEHFEADDMHVEESASEDGAKEEREFFESIPDVDAVVVLAGEIERKTANVGGREEVRFVPDIESKMRSLGALELYRHGKIKKIIIPGGVGKEKFDEATPSISETMRDYLVARGVPIEDIIIESESVNTKDNLEQIMPILEKNEIKKFLLETNEYHMGRSKDLLKNILKEKNITLESSSVTAEEILRVRSLHYKKLVEAYEFPKSLKNASLSSVKKGMWEFLRRGLIAIDPHDKIATYVAKKVRK